jgi:hypothetical protein
MPVNHPDQPWFHGGAGGLEAGAVLLPPSRTGQTVHSLRTRIVTEVLAAGLPVSGHLERLAARLTSDPDPAAEESRVFVTQARPPALWFACYYSTWMQLTGAPGSGRVYRARPRGRIEPDPTIEQSVSCDHAEVIAVEYRAAPVLPGSQQLAQQWSDCYRIWRDELNGGIDWWARPTGGTTR